MMSVVQVLQEEGIGISDDFARELSSGTFTAILTLLMKSSRKKNMVTLRVLTTGTLLFGSVLSFISQEPVAQQLALSATAGNLAIEVGPAVIRGMGVIAQALIHRRR